MQGGVGPTTSACRARARVTAPRRARGGTGPPRIACLWEGSAGTRAAAPNNFLNSMTPHTVLFSLSLSLSLSLSEAGGAGRAS